MTDDDKKLLENWKSQYAAIIDNNPELIDIVEATTEITIQLLAIKDKQIEAAILDSFISGMKFMQRNDNPFHIDEEI